MVADIFVDEISFNIFVLQICERVVLGRLPRVKEQSSRLVLACEELCLNTNTGSAYGA